MHGQNFWAPIPSDFTTFLHTKLGMNEGLVEKCILDSDQEFLSSLVEN